MTRRSYQPPPALFFQVEPLHSPQTLHSRIQGVPPLLPLRLRLDVAPRLRPELRSHERRTPRRPHQALRCALNAQPDLAVLLADFQRVTRARQRMSSPGHRGRSFRQSPKSRTSLRKERPAHLHLPPYLPQFCLPMMPPRSPTPLLVSRSRDPRSSKDPRRVNVDECISKYDRVFRSYGRPYHCDILQIGFVSEFLSGDAQCFIAPQEKLEQSEMTEWFQTWGSFKEGCVSDTTTSDSR